MRPRPVLLSDGGTRGPGLRRLREFQHLRTEPVPGRLLRRRRNDLEAPEPRGSDPGPRLSRQRGGRHHPLRLSVPLYGDVERRRGSERSDREHGGRDVGRRSQLRLRSPDQPVQDEPRRLPRPLPRRRPDLDRLHDRQCSRRSVLPLGGVRPRRPGRRRLHGPRLLGGPGCLPVRLLPHPADLRRSGTNRLLVEAKARHRPLRSRELRVARRQHPLHRRLRGSSGRLDRPHLGAVDRHARPRGAGRPAARPAPGGRPPPRSRPSSLDRAPPSGTAYRFPVAKPRTRPDYRRAP